MHLYTCITSVAKDCLDADDRSLLTLAERNAYLTLWNKSLPVMATTAVVDQWN